MPIRGALKKPAFLILFFILSFNPRPAAAALQEFASDEEFLDAIQQKIFHYFEVERNPVTGLVRDRAHNFQEGARRAQASIAATGFALTVYPVAVKRDWLDHGSALEMTKRTLEFFLLSAAGDHGFFYHYMDPETGKRGNGSELSPIDTALFLAGVLFAAEYFEDPKVRDLAEELYGRVDWPWMLHGGETFALAWSPENGFTKGRWDRYNESMILYLLAIGSPTHPIPPESWRAILRPAGSYRSYRVIEMPPLFTHQYSHVWIDFRNKNDGIADYFQNSVNATLAQRQFAIDQSVNSESYGPDSWGLTATDGPFGYRAYGGPPGWIDQDGTVAPSACGSSIVFTPKESIACLHHFYENWGEELWGRYGFSSSLNPQKKWVGQEVIGIDEGALFLMIENYGSGFVWEVMSRNLYLQNAMEKVGFKPGAKEIPWLDPPVYEAPYIFGGVKIDGYLKDWPSRKAMVLDRSFRELGDFKNDEDLHGEIRFAWDEQALYFSAQVTDDDLVLKRSGKNIWQDEMLEIYLDPSGDGLHWYDTQDFQIGFRVHTEDEGVEAWSWFQGGEDPIASGMAEARGFAYEKGYLIEGALRWKDLGIQPSAGKEIRLSVALHDMDRDRSDGKFQWFFRNEEAPKRFVLGKLTLQGPETGKKNEN